MLRIRTAVPGQAECEPALSPAPAMTPRRARWTVRSVLGPLGVLLLWLTSWTSATAPPLPPPGQGAALGTAISTSAHGRLATPAFVCTADLELALQAVSPEAAQRSAEVARREGELRLAELGLSTVLSVTSGVDVGSNLRREQPAEWAASLQMDAAASYRYDEVAVVRARTALTTALKREADQRRADVQNALIQLSRLRAAQRQWAQSDVTATEAESLAASVRRSVITAQGVEGSSEPPTEHAPLPAADLAPDLVLDIRELDLAAARARATASGRAEEAAAAVAELERLGVPLPAITAHASRSADTGPVACLAPAAGTMNRTDGPTLPQPALGGTAERLLLVHAADLAAAQSRRATLGPLHDLSLSGHYQQGGARVRAALELDGGRPAAGVDLRLRQSAAHDWGVGLSATIRLDDSTGAALTAAAVQLETAHAALDDFDAHLPERVAAQTAAVGSAWLQLAFAAEAVSIAAERLDLARSESAAERDIARAEQVLSRSVDALEREYQTYLRAVGRYLAEFDLPWSSVLEE